MYWNISWYFVMLLSRRKVLKAGIKLIMLIGFALFVCFLLTLTCWKEEPYFCRYHWFVVVRWTWNLVNRGKCEGDNGLGLEEIRLTNSHVMWVIFASCVMWKILHGVFSKAYSWNYFSYVYLDTAFWEIYSLIMRIVLEFWVVWILHRCIQDLVKML